MYRPGATSASSSSHVAVRATPAASPVDHTARIRGNPPRDADGFRVCQDGLPVRVPKNLPKSFLAEPRRFGHGDAVWRPTAADRPVEVAVAWLQHRLAIEIRSEVTATVLEKSLAAPRGSIAAKLSGNDWIQTHDILLWRFVVPSDLGSVLASPDVFPDEYGPWLEGWMLGAQAPMFSEPRDRDVAGLSVLQIAQNLENATVARCGAAITAEVITFWMYESLVSRDIDARTIFTGRQPDDGFSIVWGSRSLGQSQSGGGTCDR